jgi:very-short-patch-repair endonuclease
MFVDLAEEETSGKLANLLHETAFHELLDLDALDRAAHEHATRHGNPTLVAALELHRSGQAGAMSRLEERVLARLIRSGASMPQVNPRVCGVRCDLYWPEARLVVEIDGPGHDRPRTRRDDAIRAARLESVGIDVIRVRHDAIESGVRAVMRHLHATGVCDATQTLFASGAADQPAPGAMPV